MIKHAFNILIPALFAAIMILISCVAFASLIFSGDAAPFLGPGIMVLVYGAVIVGLIYGCIGAYRMVVTQPDDDTAPIYAAMIAGLLLTLPKGLAPELVFWNALFLIGTATLVSGLVLILLGQLKAGSAIEFIPYSVMGGYFATAGWLLTAGGIGAGSGISLERLIDGASDSKVELAMLAATIVYALFLFFIRNHKLKNVFLVLSMIGGIGLFYGLVSIFQSHLPDGVVERVTLGQLFVDGNDFTFGPGAFFHSIQRVSSEAMLIKDAIPSLAVIVVLSCVSTLLTISGLNLLVQTDVQASSELKRIGFSNLASGLAGGMAAFPSVSLSSLVQSMGAPQSRWLAVSTALMVAIFAHLALGLLSYIPKPVIGGLLLSMGLAFLYEWLVESRSHYPLHEYLVIPTILLVAIFFGFLQGVFVGLLAATILFVIKYSQQTVIRFEGDGSLFRSNVDRSSEQIEHLQQASQEILIIGLQGFLFFGTAGRLYSRIKDLLEETSSVKYILLDFEQVHGIDASAGLNFDKLAQLVTLRKIYLLIAGMDNHLVSNFSSTTVDLDAIEYALPMPDIDHALEWYEERVLSDIDADEEKTFNFLADLEVNSPELHELFLANLESRQVDSGYVLASQGDESDELYLMMSSGASAYIDDGKGGRLRVRRVAAGAIYGEIGFFLGSPRTASIVVDDPGRIYILNRSAYKKLQHENPELIAKFQEHLLSSSIERLLFTTQTLSTVMR